MKNEVNKLHEALKNSSGALRTILESQHAPKPAAPAPPRSDLHQSLITTAEALHDALKAVETDNRAAWKARRKIATAIEHLIGDDWPKADEKHEMPTEEGGASVPASETK